MSSKNKLAMTLNLAVLYLRVSSDEQAKHGFSIENQKKDCLKFAEQEGYQVVKIFIDEGKSAKNLDRPEMKELMGFCSKKKNNVNAVIVWRLDRISRNNSDYHGALRPLFEGMKIQLLSATEANVSTLEGDLMRNIGMSFAEYERKLIGARTVAGLREKARQGQYPHKAPIGYKNIELPNGSRGIIIDEEYAFYVKQAFNLYDTGLYSLRSLTQKLAEDGLRSKKGHLIPKTTIERMLKNIFYTGVFSFEGIINENAKHPAIIDKELFYRVQNRLIDPKKSRLRTYDFTYKGLIHCKHCGCLLCGEFKKGKYIYYHCTGNRGGNCKQTYIREDQIDKSVCETLKLIKLPIELKDKIYNELKIVHEQKTGYTKNIKANIQKQITVLSNRIESAFNEKLDHNITHEEWEKYNSKYQAEKAKLMLQLQEIEKVDTEFYEHASTLLSFTEDAYNLFLTGSLEQKKKVLEIISEEIVHQDKNIYIKLRPVFRTIAQNQYKLAQEGANIRTLETGINKGLEPNSNPKLIKNSPHRTTLESFTQELYHKIIDFNSSKIVAMIENLKMLA